MALKTSDHELLHDWVARAALAGSAVSVLELLIGSRLGGGLTPLFEALRIAGIVAAVVPPRSLTDGAGLTFLALAAGAASMMRTPVALPAAALLTGLALARTLSPVPTLRRRLETLGIATAAALAAFVIRRGLMTAEVFVPAFGPGVSALAAGAIAGAVTGLGAIGRLFSGPVSPAATVGDEFEQLAVSIAPTNPEVASLLRRAAVAHRQAAEVVTALGVKGEPATQIAADGLLHKMIKFARDWQDIELRSANTQPEALTERRALLEDRMDKTEDPIAKSELQRAILAVAAQSDAIAEIRRGRERVLARMEHQVATLERLRLAALRHRSADASRIQAELQPVLDELAEAGGDFDLESAAMGDADRETTTLVPTPVR